MLAHTDFNDISIGTYKQATKFILPDSAYITCTLKLVNVEVISNIQYYISTRKTPPEK